MEKEIELNEEDLDQIFGGIPFEEAKDKALNDKNIHRIKISKRTIKSIY